MQNGRSSISSWISVGAAVSFDVIRKNAAAGVQG
jgi:hypothetical protein